MPFVLAQVVGKGGTIMTFDQAIQKLYTVNEPWAIEIISILHSQSQGLLRWQNTSIELNRQISVLEREVVELRRGEWKAE